MIKKFRENRRRRTATQLALTPKSEYSIYFCYVVLLYGFLSLERLLLRCIYDVTVQ
jgi:hypothetical protein